jgi:type 1 glutamine amidotransferase
MQRLFSLAAILLSVGLSVTAKAPSPPHIVFMIGEDEYHTWDTLPDFAKRELEPRGYLVTTIQQDAKDKNNFPGLVEALKSADLLFISARRRTPPADQMNAVRAHLDAGKALVGIRTACHAFALRPTDPPAGPNQTVWQAFDPQVLGGHYTNHHPEGPRTSVSIAPGATSHQILKGVSLSALVGAGSLYKVSPLEPGTTPLLVGTIPDQPAEPIAWTNRYGVKRARVFYTSLGHPDDFTNAEFRRLLVNGIAWALGRSNPSP